MDYQLRQILLYECDECGKKVWAEPGDTIPYHQHAWRLAGVTWLNDAELTGDPD